MLYTDHCVAPHGCSKGEKLTADCRFLTSDRHGVIWPAITVAVNKPTADLVDNRTLDDAIELRLNRAVAKTDTSFIRQLVRQRAEAEGSPCFQVELVQFHVFLHCTRGAGRHMVDFEEIEVSEGVAIWIRPGQVQRWSETRDDFDADVVVFESSSIPELPLFDHFAGGTSIAHLGSDSSRLQEQIRWMAIDLESTDDESVAAAVVGVILRLFARNADSNTVSDDPRRRLARAFINSIDDNIDQRSVTWHAQEIGASTRSVSRATIETLELRPKEVVDSRVILEAQRRLAWSDDDVATIARALRFSEASNFTKFFRTRTGTSPSEFRQSVTNLDDPEN